MADFAARSRESEWMDAPDVSLPDMRACLRDLERANRATLGYRPTLAWLERQARTLPEGARFTLLDVGPGGGDMLRVIRRWAQRRGLRPRLVGVDLNPLCTAIARERTDPALGIELITGDAFRLSETVDFVVSALVTHHMTDDEVVRFLKWMDEKAQRGWFVNDLHRHALAYYGFAALSWAARWHRFVRHDGPVSVARGFRGGEWRSLLARAGVRGAAVRWHMPFRLCVGKPA